MQAWKQKRRVEDAATKTEEGRFTDNQHTHGGCWLKAALHPNARGTGGSGFLSVALGRCHFAKPQGTVHSLHGSAPILYRRALRHA